MVAIQLSNLCSLVVDYVILFFFNILNLKVES